jgi:hypothetical protein
VVFQYWFDDSADANRKKFVLAAGLYGDLRCWKVFDKAWKMALHSHPRIEYFHNKEWASLTGQFKQFTDLAKYPKPQGGDAANEKKELLKTVVSRGDVVGTAIAVMVDDYNIIRDAHPRAAELFPKDPYEGGISSVFMEGIRTVRSLGKVNRVAFFSDDSNKAPVYTEIYNRFKARYKKQAKYLLGLRHLNDEIFSPLQAADLVASSAKKIIEKIADIPYGNRPIVEELPDFKNTFYKVSHWDLRYMCGVLLEETGVDLFGAFRIEKKKYKSDVEIYEEIKRKGKGAEEVCRGAALS